jgi:hypothetical protein
LDKAISTSIEAHNHIKAYVEISEGYHPYQNGAYAEYIPSLCQPFAKVVCGIYFAKLSQMVIHS